MTQPPAYNPAYSFTDFSSGSPTSQPPGEKLDAEFNAIEETLDAVLDRMALIQRDDGKLANQSVGADQLGASALALLDPDGTAAASAATATEQAVIAEDAAALSLSSSVSARARALGGYIPSRFLTRRVMSSPPTVAYSSSSAHTVSSPIFVQAADGATVSSTFNYRKCSKVTAANALVSAKSVTSTLTPGALNGSHLSSFAFTYDGTAIALQFSNNSQDYWIKVDGEYVSLTATSCTSGGALGTIQLTFGSAAMREIEFILAGVGDEMRFSGAFIEQTASIAPVAPRGPKVIVMGDSFGEGTGATSAINSYPMILSDTLGWDDIITSSTGGAGLLATSSGTKLTYRQRFALDVAPFAPDILIIQGSINDSTQTTAAVSAELQLLIAEIRAALPYCKIIVTSMMAASGGGFASPGFYLAAEGMKQGAEAAGVDFINLLEQDLPATPAQPSGVITRVAAVNATRIYTNVQMAKNTTLKFTNGTHFRVTQGTPSGSGDFICDGDRAYAGVAIGDAFTVAGNGAWSGNGKVGATASNGNCDRVVGTDGVHPSDAGHIMIGNGIAYGAAAALAAA